MIKLRTLNDSGVEEFRRYIDGLRQGLPMPRPDLNTFSYSREYMPAPEIDENKVFQTRLEMGKYLAERFEQAGIKRENVIDSLKLWTWLAYIWFEQITDGRKRLRENARYICSRDYTDYYRHSVAFAYNTYSLHGEENSKLFLNTKPYTFSDFAEQVASRQFIISNPKLVSAIHMLYWDSNGDRLKRGATDRNRPGNIRRFVKIMYQIELTYDIYVAPEKLISLLPKEFDAWRNSSSTRAH
jgi:hypothetical protein